MNNLIDLLVQNNCIFDLTVSLNHVSILFHQLFYLLKNDVSELKKKKIRTDSFCEPQRLLMFTSLSLLDHATSHVFSFLLPSRLLNDLKLYMLQTDQFSKTEICMILLKCFIKLTLQDVFFSKCTFQNYDYV